MHRSETRPFGPLSDFVVEELSQLLVDDHAVIPSKVDGFLKSILDDDELSKVYLYNRELALLDLKFCEVAMIRKGMEVPLILTNAVDFFSGSTNIPGLQYHELVRVNPKNDMRAFTTGEARETEIMFYDSHRFMEERFARLIVAIEDFLDEDKKSSQLLTGYRELMDVSPPREVMIRLKNMMDGHFPAFRPYISEPCPVRQYDGPSGASSWRIRYIERLVWGNTLPQDYWDETINKIPYYSVTGRGKIAREVSPLTSKGSLLNHTDQVDVVDAIWSWISFIKRFREMHLNAIRKQLPGLVEDEMKGTSGNLKPGTYLRSRIDSMDELYEKFKTEHPRS